MFRFFLMKPSRTDKKPAPNSIFTRAEATAFSSSLLSVTNLMGQSRLVPWTWLISQGVRMPKLPTSLETDSKNARWSTQVLAAWVASSRPSKITLSIFRIGTLSWRRCSSNISRKIPKLWWSWTLRHSLLTRSRAWQPSSLRAMSISASSNEYSNLLW